MKKRQKPKHRIICIECDKEHMAWRKNAKYCSRNCMNIGFTKNPPNYKNGSITWNGYRLIKKPDHPNSNSIGYIREHRIVMENKLGRYLLSSEEVHHINGDRLDNREENLSLMKNRTEHIKHEIKKGSYNTRAYKMSRYMNKKRDEKGRFVAT